MDIIYSIDSKKVINFYDTSGEFSPTGSMPYFQVLNDCKQKKVNLTDFKVWAWISQEEKNNIPKEFFDNPENFSVIEDLETNTPIGLENNGSKFFLRKIKLFEDIKDIPIIWSGMFFNSISYSLINRKIIFGLQDRGFNIYASGMRSKNYSEISEEERIRLEKMGCFSLHLDKKDAIRIYCYLPISRTAPALYNISYTMMESDSVSKNLVSTLNAYNDECWFPCLTEHSYILSENRYLVPIRNVDINAKVITHTNTLNNIKVKSNRKYSGKLFTINTYLKNNHLTSTEEHPFLIINESKIEQKKANELDKNDWLFYPRQNNSNEDIFQFKISNILKTNKERPEYIRTKSGKMFFTKIKLFYNHMLEKDDFYFPLLDGYGEINDEIYFSEDLVKLITIYSENQELKFKNDDNLADYFFEISKKVFGNNLNIKINKAEKNTTIYISESYLELLNYFTNPILEEEIHIKKESFDITKLFNLNHKKQAIKTLLEINNLSINDTIKIRLKGRKKVMYYTGFLLDLGIIPTIKYETIVNDLNSQYLATIHIEQEQKELLFDLLNNKIEYIESFSNDVIAVTKDKVLFKILSIDKKDAINVDVFNLEVEKDNTYVANFIANHNCNFNINGFKEEGLQTNVSHMPLACDHHIYNPEVEKLDLKKLKLEIINNNKEDYPSKPEGFIFLSVFRYSYRKGPDLLIKSFKEAFSKKDKVALIIFSRHYLGNIENDEINTISAVRADLKKWLGDDNDCAPIYWSYDYLEEEDMPKLFKASDCFISTSRGEGMCLPVLEAGACEIPVIAPNNSAFGDYMTNERGYVIETDGVENCGHVEWENGKAKYVGDNKEWMIWITEGFANQYFPIFGEKAIKQTASHMKEIYENYDIAKDKAKKMREHILNNYTWEKCIDRIADRIKEILGKFKN